MVAFIFTTDRKTVLEIIIFFFEYRVFEDLSEIAFSNNWYNHAIRKLKLQSFIRLVNASKFFLVKFFEFYQLSSLVS